MRRRLNLVDRLRQLDPAWRTACVAFMVARLALTGWSLLILTVFPTAVQNLDLFGTPVLAAFDLGTSERYTFARQIDNATLSFVPAERGNVADIQTGSLWSLGQGRAIQGRYQGVPFGPSPYTAEEVFPYRGVPSQAGMLLGIWQRFDTNWYLKIAQQGYAADDGSIAFFPLYPLLIRIGGALLQNNLLVALLISNLAVIGVFYFLYRAANRLAYPQAAVRAVLFLAIFPTSFFLFAGYTESLFLLLALASLDAGWQNRWGMAGILGALAALTKLQGVLLVLPLLYLWWKQARLVRSQASETFRVFDVMRELAPLALIPLTTAALLLWEYWFVDRAFLLTSYEGQLYAQFVFPWENVGAAIGLWTAGQATVVDILNLLATILFALIAIPVLVKLPREYGLYTLAMLLAPLFRMTTQQPLVSMLRYVIVLFPVFMLWAIWAKNAWINRAIVYFSFPLALYTSAQFMLWGWVG